MSLEIDYGQHYTDEAISAALVGHLNVPTPSRVMDIGVGHGSLLASAAQRWKSATLIGVDVDPANVIRTQSRLSGSQIHHEDGLVPDLLSRLGYSIGSVDLALCNPPFTKTNIDVAELAVQLGLPSAAPLKGNETELAFLSRNLEHLRQNGTLGIILPDCYISGRRYEEVRRALMATHAIEAVVQLPQRTFSTADVKTHFVIIRKGGITREIRLHRLDEEANWSSPLFVACVDAIKRFDYDYHATRALVHSTGLTLAELGIDIRRGSYSMADARIKNITVFHTTDFKHHQDGKVAWISGEQDIRGLRAAPGDILIPRVGSRCLHYCAYVESGSVILTDCVFRLRAPEPIQNALWEFLRGPSGIMARLGLAYGSCAKLINKATLLELRPILP